VSRASGHFTDILRQRPGGDPAALRVAADDLEAHEVVIGSAADRVEHARRRVISSARGSTADTAAGRIGTVGAGVRSAGVAARRTAGVLRGVADDLDTGNACVTGVAARYAEVVDRAGVQARRFYASNAGTRGAGPYATAWFERITDRYGRDAVRAARFAHRRTSDALAQADFGDPQPPTPSEPGARAVSRQILDPDLAAEQGYRVLETTTGAGKESFVVTNASGEPLWSATKEGSIIADTRHDQWSVRATKEGLRVLVEKLTTNEVAWAKVASEKRFGERLLAGLSLGLAGAGALGHSPTDPVIDARVRRVLDRRRAALGYPMHRATWRRLIRPGMLGGGLVLGLSAWAAGSAATKVDSAVLDIRLMRKRLTEGITLLEENPGHRYVELSNVDLPPGDNPAEQIERPAFGTGFGTFDPRVPKLVPDDDGVVPRPHLLESDPH
jgi:hypothetical protein